MRYLKTLVSALRRPDPGVLENFARAIWLSEKLRQDGIIHVHAHFVNEPAGVAEFVWQLTGLPFSLSAHAKDIYLSPPDVLQRKLAHARFTVTCTEHNRNYLASIARPGTRVSRMYHGIDSKLFEPDRRYPLISSSRLVLSVGRLRAKKGFACLIDACGKLAAQGVEFHCEIIGYGPEKEHLERRIAHAGLENRVSLLGKLTHAEVIARYKEAALFVLPCQVMSDGDRDGVPNALLEAMAMRLPVVSTTVSGIPEAVTHGENGLLVPPGDSAAIAHAITTLLGNTGLCDRLGAAARETVVRKYSDRNLELLISLLPDIRRQAGDELSSKGVVSGAYI